MSALTLESTIDEKIKDLCETILADEEYRQGVAHIEALLDDPVAKADYVKFAEKGDQMHHKQHEGEEVTDDDLESYEALRKAADANPKVNAFMDAQNELNALHRKVSKYISKTIESGRVPTAEEMEAKDGCCGGGCGCE